MIGHDLNLGNNAVGSHPRVEIPGDTHAPQGNAITPLKNIPRCSEPPAPDGT